MIDLDPTALSLEFGGGAVIGGLIGFAAKKIAKVLAIIVGVQLMFFRYLESQGIIKREVTPRAQRTPTGSSRSSRRYRSARALPVGS